MSIEGTLERLRREYHRELCGKIVAKVTATKKAKKARTKDGGAILEIEAGTEVQLSEQVDKAEIQVSYYNIADGDNRNSKVIAESLIDSLGHDLASKAPNAQQSGALFGEITCQFLRNCFDQLVHLRPGHFSFSASQAKAGISLYDQYEHLKILSKFIKEHKEIRATLGGEYLIKPDIVVVKRPFTDDEINRSQLVLGIDARVANLSPARAKNSHAATLHASVSCKWTMRSDRAQNVRTEALNLIRNRKGQTPRIVFVTFEPLPSRLISAAVGTGDIDCTYHVALHELRDCIEKLDLQDQLEQLDDLITGRRIRDISDLPLDLII